MTVLRTGIDLVAVADVRAAMDTHGHRYLDRVFTSTEQADCRRQDGTLDPQRLAARFAAKEAAIKVLRPGRDTPVPWRTIEVVRHPEGWVDLRWHGPAATLAAVGGVGEPALSLAHEHGTAVATVVASCASISRPSTTPPQPTESLL